MKPSFLESRSDRVDGSDGLGRGRRVSEGDGVLRVSASAESRERGSIANNPFCLRGTARSTDFGDA